MILKFSCGNAEIIRLLLTTEYPKEELKFYEFPQDAQRDGDPREGYLFACDLNAMDNEHRNPLVNCEKKICNWQR